MVMPLYDDNPFKLPHRPIVTWTLIGVNLLVFLAEVGLGRSGHPGACVRGNARGLRRRRDHSGRARRSRPFSPTSSCTPI